MKISAIDFSQDVRFMFQQQHEMMLMNKEEEKNCGEKHEEDEEFPELSDILLCHVCDADVATANLL